MSLEHKRAEVVVLQQGCESSYLILGYSCGPRSGASAAPPSHGAWAGMQL